MAESSIVQSCVCTKAKSISTITAEHYWIHYGRLYTTNKFSTSVGGSSWIDITMVTPNSTEIHLKEIRIAHSPGACECLIFENPTTTTLSTSINFTIQRNRKSQNVQSVIPYINSTCVLGSSATSTQATVVSRMLFGSTGSMAMGGQFGSYFQQLDLVLKQNSTYMIRLYDLSGNAGYSSITAHWFEYY